MEKDEHGYIAEEIHEYNGDRLTEPSRHPPRIGGIFFYFGNHIETPYVPRLSQAPDVCNGNSRHRGKKSTSSARGAWGGGRGTGG